MKAETLRPEFVESVPKALEAGVLYVSLRYHTVIHLCCCGCGREVVTPIGPSRWAMSVHDGRVSLSPSIGNWSYPCRSHYWIRSNRVEWAGQLSARKISEIRARDLRDFEHSYGSRREPEFPPTRAWRKLRSWLESMFKHSS